MQTIRPHCTWCVWHFFICCVNTGLLNLRCNHPKLNKWWNFSVKKHGWLCEQLEWLKTDSSYSIQFINQLFFWCEQVQQHYKNILIAAKYFFTTSYECDFSRSTPKDILADLSASSLSDDVYQQTISLLQQVKTSCIRSPAAGALFMEELAIAIRQGDIHEKVEVEFLCIFRDGNSVLNCVLTLYIININL